MENPVVVEITRGDLVESFHRGAFALVDGAGAIVVSAGDIERPVFPRSAVKLLQAIPLVETGAAAYFGLDDKDLSLACASHSGEPAHVRRAAAMLAKAGLDGGVLECGCHWPFDAAVARDLARSGETLTALHNNCSGKHAGFVLTAVQRGETTAGYVGPNHPVQLRAKAVIEDLVGHSLNRDVCGTDGCSIPTYAAPLRDFAGAFAKIATGKGVGAPRAEAGRALMRACMAEPFEMSGTGRACRRLMEAEPGKVFAKTGAEGVFCGALPELGLGFALKIDDGATRASEALVAALIAKALESEDAALAARFAAMATHDMVNWEGIRTGDVRAILPQRG
ncbi:asparaginase [Jiella sp. MQZ9-1]|uniref:Asparaginase n=1 Tax=Jiella flava TaxID=2816857 RepID=A0A939FUC8_9HYPH|nr:asparaginase [Jiella flava]MBO0661605.1 asparaginase [Jiella flava]MCD2470247.1 asparaginase [Jiella flava]